MDHLLLPVNRQHQHLDIPYVLPVDDDDDPYDNGDFASYMDRNGTWSLRDIDTPSKSDISQHQLSQLVQRWLFFGLLCQVFGNSLPQRQFVKTSQTGLLVLTMVPYWEFWHQHSSKGTTSGDEDRLHILRCVSLAAGLVGGVHVDIVSVEEELELVLLSVMTLCDSISAILDPNNPKIPSRQWPLSDNAIENIMRLDGWCESDILRMSEELDVSSLYFVSRMKPRIAGGHRSCSAVRCTANHVEAGRYERKHVRCSGCSDRPIIFDQVLSILESDSLPLISPFQDDEATIKLISTAEVDKYLAISHVWSDGLGNHEQNAIFNCQLSWLLEIGQKIAPTCLPIWLDTLSCPIDGELMDTRTKEAYDKAISFMRRTYSEAEMVLVLDRALLSISTVGLTELDILLHIFTCGWTRRLWTYQEGVLAKNLYFQFNDRAVDIDLTFQDWQQNNMSSYFPGIRGAVDGLRVLREAESQDSRLTILQRVSRTLKFRSTSEASDEALCLSTLARLPPERVAAVSSSVGSLRMKAFYENLQQVSTQIVFWHGQRLTHPGFRWAPASLLDNGSIFFAQRMPHTQPASIRPDGLHFQGPGLVLGNWNADVQSFIFKAPTGFWYQATCRQHDGEKGSPCRLICPFDAETDERDRSRLALLTQGLLEEGLETPGFEACTALLVSINDTTDGVFHASTLCSVFVFRILHIESEFPLVMKTCDLFKRTFESLNSETEGFGSRRVHSENDEDDDGDFWLLEEEALVNEFKRIGPRAIIEATNPRPNDETVHRLWAGTKYSNGLLSLVREGLHNVFEAGDIVASQQWALD